MASPAPTLTVGMLVKSLVVRSPFLRTSLTCQNVSARSPKGTHRRRPPARCSLTPRSTWANVILSNASSPRLLMSAYAPAQVGGDDPVEAIADPEAHECCSVGRVTFEGNGRRSRTQTECPPLRPGRLRAALGNEREVEQDREQDAAPSRAAGRHGAHLPPDAPRTCRHHRLRSASARRGKQWRPASCRENGRTRRSSRSVVARAKVAHSS